MQNDDVNGSLTLKERIAQDSARIVADIRSGLGSLEVEYLKARKDQKLGVFLLFLAFALMYLFEFGIENAFIITISVIASISCLYFSFRLLSGKLGVINAYNDSLNRIIYTEAFLLLGLDGRVLMIENSQTEDSTITEKNWWQKFYQSIKKVESADLVTTLAELENSELITEPHNTNLIDDIFEISYKDSIIRVAELDIRHETGSGKNRRTNYIFHGYLVSYDLKRELAGKTFVTTENDRQGFANLAFFNRGGVGAVKETVLEWNEFENLLHVATNNEVEARYILTPNFMHDLYDWWQGRETNIRLSFIKNRLYILYPDKKIRLNQTVEKITDESITEYLHTIVWPLQNVIKLIDDVPL